MSNRPYPTIYLTNETKEKMDKRQLVRPVLCVTYVPLEDQLLQPFKGPLTSLLFLYAL